MCVVFIVWCVLNCSGNSRCFLCFSRFFVCFYSFLSLTHSLIRLLDAYQKTKDTYLDAEAGRNLSAHLVFVRFICLFRCYHLYCNIQYYVIICCNLSCDSILEGTICDLRMTETICINWEWVWMSLSAPLYICTWYQFTSFFVCCFVEVSDHFVKRESYLWTVVNNIYIFVQEFGACNF